MLPQTKLISFIVPSRLRKDMLVNCIKELVAQVPAESRKLIEFIVRLDNDDPSLAETIAALPFSEADIQVITGYRGKGYLEGYIWCEECARLSRGTYFALWNDDAKFATENWFEIFYNRIKEEKGIYSYWFSGIKVEIYSPQHGMSEGEWPSFIFHHRKFWEILGFISGKGGVDSFIYYVLDPLGLFKKIPEIVIDHIPWYKKPKEEWDEVTKDNAKPGQMVPTDMELVKRCQEKIIAYARNNPPKQ